MATKQQSEREEFVSIMASECPGCDLGALQEIMRLARRHHQLAERACNGHQTPSGHWNQKAAERDEKASERLEARISALCAEIGCKAVFSGDPRGATVKLIVPSGHSDSWGGVGICVPT